MTSSITGGISILAMFSAGICGAKQMSPAGHSETSKDVFHRCLDESDQNTWAMIECNAEEWSRRDKKLNETYRYVLKRLPPAKQEKLKILERRWVHGLKAACTAETVKMTGGIEAQDGRLYWSGCMLDATIARIKWLQAFGRFGDR